jgi:hypothetical protein
VDVVQRGSSTTVEEKDFHSVGKERLKNLAEGEGEFGKWGRKHQEE